MAIDSREKRAAIPGVGRPWMRGKLPVATSDEQSRSATGLTYGGNALSGVAPTGGPFPHFIRRSQSLTGGLIGLGQ